MITRTESGLSAADYAALQAATGDLAVEIDLQRYGPVWAAHPDTHASGWSGRNFDAILVGSWLVKAYNPNISNISTVSDISAFYLASEVSGTSDSSWVAIPQVPPDMDAEVPLSLAADGTTVYMFYYSLFDEKIRYVTAAIPGGSWGVSLEVGAVANVRYLMATSHAKVHYITRTATKMNWRLHYYENDGGWSATDSDIYWQFPIYAADAVDMGTYDLVMLATEMSPYMGSRAVGTKVTTEANRVQAIVTFRETGGRWSDHGQLDTIDIIDKDRSRDNLRLTYHNGYLFATYLRCGGQDDHTYSEAFVSRSRDDSKGWEFPERVTASFTTPFLVLPRAADYLYAVGIAATQRSYPCVWTGMTPEELDITRYITGLESTAADIRNTSMEMSNPADVLDGTLAKAAARLQAIYRLGYQDGADTLLCQVSTEDVMGWRDQLAMPHQGLSIHTQDRLGRVNRTRSDYAAEWPGHQAGRDPYTDPTGTGYGGLRYTAPYQGSWKAYDGELRLIASENEGIAVSTLVTDALNGAAQTGFRLDTASKGEYAGVSWHVYDKDNLFFAAYYLDDDVIRLTRRIGGHDEALATSNAMSWAVDTWYWIRAWVHYGMVYVYTSADGITFSGPLAWASGNGEMHAQADWAGSTATAWTGKFGMIGYGYSDEDTWDDWDYDPWPGPTTEPEHYGMVVLCKDVLARSWNFFTLTQTCAWEDIKGSITGDLYHFAIGGDRQAWVTSADGLWYTGDIGAPTITWTCVKTVAAATAETGLAYIFLPVDVTPGGIVYAPWCGNYNPNCGYYSGTAGSVAFSIYPQYDGQHVHTGDTNTGYAVHCKDGTPRIACGAGGVGKALMWQADGTYIQFADARDWQMATTVVSNYISTWSAWTYSGYDPSSLVRQCGSHGIDVRGSSLLYVYGVDYHIYRDGVMIADSGTLWGLAGRGTGRVIFVENKGDHMAALINDPALGGGGESGKFVVYTKDAFVNYHDRTGDFVASVGTWGGETHANYSNVDMEQFPYNDDDL